MQLKVILAQAAQQLEAAHIPNVRLEARLLFGHCYGLSQEDILRQMLDPVVQDLEPFWTLVKQRCQQVPLAHLTGSKEFWGLSFEVSSDVLIPRPDSETLIEAVQHYWQPLNQDHPLFLDLGTGSGCLLLTLLHLYPQAFGLGIDRSDKACAMAQTNAERLGIEARGRFMVGHWTDCLLPSLKFDVIISNPPYLRSNDPQVAADVRQFEPSLALWGGDDGLTVYQHFAQTLQHFIKPDGVVVLEIGHDQASAISDLFLSSCLEIMAIRQDLAGHDRCLVLKLKVY